MEFNADLVQSLVIGASGGIPTTLLLLHKMEVFSSRLQKLEVAFDVLFQSELKRISESHSRLEARIHALETAGNRLPT
jgi:hypothetical protein